MIDNWNWAEKLVSMQNRRNSGHDADRDVRHHHGGDSHNCVQMDACSRNVCRSFEVAVPVTIRPIGLPLPPSVSCGGDVAVTTGRDRCCSPRSFDFTITQVVNVDIPIEFGVEVCYHSPCAEDNGPCSVAGADLCGNY